MLITGRTVRRGSFPTEIDAAGIGIALKHGHGTGTAHGTDQFTDTGTAPARPTAHGTDQFTDTDTNKRR